MYYYLENKVPVAVDDITKWTEKFEGSRQISKDYFGEVIVSTVFLGLDHRYGGEGPPILFETMIFNGRHDGYQERYCTWDEAEAGHEIAVSKVNTMWFKLLKWTKNAYNKLKAWLKKLA